MPGSDIGLDEQLQLWQSAYAELVFDNVLWPDVDRRDLRRACETYGERV